MKICVRCNVEKNDSGFYTKTERNGKKRLCSWCKQCSIDSATACNKRLREEQPEIYKERYKAHWEKTKHIQNPKVRARNKRFKRKCVDYLGGGCHVCGYDRCLAALDFHHTDPKEKDLTVSKYTIFEKAKLELDKCVLMCSNCHKEFHYKEVA